MRSAAFILLLLLLETLFVLVAVNGEVNPWLFFHASVGGAAVWLGIVLFLQSDMPRWTLPAVLTAAVVMRLTLIGTGPIASDDMYRYIWDGKVQAQGIDPYLHAPEDEALADLHGPLLPASINFPSMKTVYPPLAQWVFFLTYSIGGASVLAFKIPLLLADAATIILILLLLRQYGIASHAVGIYALNPLVILQFMVDGHLDVIGFPFVLAFLLLYEKRSRIAGAVMLGLSIAVKLLSVIFVPLLLRDAWERKHLWMMAALAVPVLIYLPYMLSAGSPFESLAVYTARWSFNGSLYPLLLALLDTSSTARPVAMGLTVVGVLLLAMTRRPLVWKLAGATVVFFLLAATVHPWYLTWTALLLPFYPRWSFVVFVATVSLSNFSGVLYHSGGPWVEPFWLGPAVYLPVFVSLLLERIGLLPLPEIPTVASPDR
ncbi:MAG: hypothetical protein KFH87_10215 [Bacteroidetes bacterium]|nr:hypothetical protein [Bacteroidota bacterium]